jgi:histone acetyltransferase (RNA polymerase elongator complex component)
MSIYHMTKAQLIRKIELDQPAIERAYQTQKENERLREQLQKKPNEVIKEVEVVKEFLPEGVTKEDISDFLAARSLLW